MPKTSKMTLVEKVVDYSGAVGRYGPESEQAKQVRAKYASDDEFEGYADALDRLKRRFSGKEQLAKSS